MPGAAKQGPHISQRDPDKLFELQQQLGSGRYGALHQARILRTGKTAAVHLVVMEDGKDYSKLENELQMLEDCHNDNIVAHYGAFMKVKTMWIAMEFCGGGSVSDRMDSLDRALSEPEIVCVMFHLLQGLTYLHKSHILHRDIRSKNILLTDRGVVKLANFQKKAGLLTSFKLAQETPIIVDTPYWIGPEVVAGGGMAMSLADIRNITGSIPQEDFDTIYQADRYTAKCDIWSLGITAIELAERVPPMFELPPMRAVYLIPRIEPPTLADKGKWSTDFSMWLKEVLIKNPARRPDAEALQKHAWFKLLTSHPKCLEELVVAPTHSAEAKRAAVVKACTAEHVYSRHEATSWDQRRTIGLSWCLLLEGAPSGTFVVRRPSSRSFITVVKPGGRLFNQRILELRVNSQEVMLDGSKHTHSSIGDMIKFYQDPMYFAQVSQPDVPALLIFPSFSGTGGKANMRAKYKSSRLKTLCADGNFKTMWWRQDGTGVVGVFGGGGTLYGNIFDAVDGGTKVQQAMFSRMVSAEARADPHNPLSRLESTPQISFAEAVALLKDHCTGNIVAESAAALDYATAHPHIGTERSSGAGVLTVDDIAVLHMYTMETDFYPRLNQELGGYGRGAARTAINAFLPIAKLLAAAMAKLPPLMVKLFRGVKMTYKAILGEDVKVGGLVNWYQFTSCSTSPEVLKDENFLGPETGGTVFQIMGVTGINIKPYSAIEGEDEVVLPPGSTFTVDKITPWKFGVSEVRMRQLVDIEMGSSGGGDSVVVEPVDVYDDVDDYLSCI